MLDGALKLEASTKLRNTPCTRMLRARRLGRWQRGALLIWALKAPVRPLIMEAESILVLVADLCLQWGAKLLPKAAGVWWCRLSNREKQHEVF